MAELKAPAGVFLLIELERDLAQCHTTQTGVWASLAQVAGIKSVTDLSSVPLVALEERVLLALTPEQLQMWRKTTRKR